MAQPHLPEYAPSFNRAELQHLLTRVISHDLNNIFTIAQSYIDLSIRIAPPEAQRNEFLSRALSAIRRGIQLNEILHTVGADRTLPAQECSLPDLLETLDPVFQRLYYPGPTLNIHVSEPLPVLLSHPVSLTRFLVDLSANAILRWHQAREILFHFAPTAEHSAIDGVLIHLSPHPSFPTRRDDALTLYLTSSLSDVLATGPVQVTLSDESIDAILPA